jgi:hypothetical protein
MHEGDHGILDHEHGRARRWTRVLAAAIAVGAVAAFLIWKLTA